MKKSKLLGVLLSITMLSACTGNGGEVSETVSETSDTVSETSVTTSITTVSETAETTAEETEAVPEAETAEEDNEPRYINTSKWTDFIDFELIKDYQGTTDIGDLADKAVEFLTTTEEYADAMSKLDEIDKEFGEPYIKDGKIVPQFEIAYPADYNGDGQTETFIALKMPMRDEYNILTTFFVFADGYGEMTLIEQAFTNERVGFLNYGMRKQLTITDDRSVYGGIVHIYGVSGRSPKLLYSGQTGLEKRGCFLYAHGFQANEHFMYFDTALGEYIQIMSEKLSHEELKKLDTSGSLDGVFEETDGNFSAWLMGGKYYLIKEMFKFAKVYTYDNGAFTLLEDPPVGLNIYYGSDMRCVADIDIDAALAEMKKPIEPFVKRSEGSGFTDYNFIGNYPGTTNIGGFADKAIAFIKDSEEYKYSMENFEVFTAEGMLKVDTKYKYTPEQAEEYAETFSEYITDGVIEPVIKAAYPNDYDGDGNSEAFIVIEMPYLPTWDKYGNIRDFVIFADKDGNMDILDITSNMYPTVLLDYGEFKHIAIGGSGTFGVEDHTDLYGVKDGKLDRLYSGRCSFYKEDCFLAVYGWQGSGGFYYYDTVLGKYLALEDVPVPLEEIKEMDKDGVLAEYYNEEDILGSVALIGGKYYCAMFGVMDTGTIYTYENGRFVLREDCNARRSGGYDDITVTDIDIDAALAQMKSVAEPFSPVTKGSTPIDFKYIENFQSDTDLERYREKISELANDAVFSRAKSHVKEISEGEFSEYADGDGNVIPKILAAYTNDYNGDGKNETFVIYETPYMVYDNDGGHLELSKYVALIDSSGKTNRWDGYSIINGSADFRVALLDYGTKKHIIFTVGEDNYTLLCGVRENRIRGYFYGEECTVQKDGCLIDITDGRDGCVLYYDNIADDYLTLSGRNYLSGSDMPNPVNLE